MFVILVKTAYSPFLVGILDPTHSLLECTMARCVWALEKKDIAEFIEGL